MYSYFGNFTDEKDLKQRMVRTFRDNPEKYLTALAERVIEGDMILTPHAEGVTVFWNDDAHKNIEQSEK